MKNPKRLYFTIACAVGIVLIAGFIMWGIIGQ